MVKISNGPVTALVVMLLPAESVATTLKDAELRSTVVTAESRTFSATSTAAPVKIKVAER